MADWDAADLVARAKRLARVPAVTEWPVDADWYAWLTEAESKWKPILARHNPGPMMEAPVKLTSADSGLTYALPNDETPIYFELYASLSGYPLVPGAFHDAFADYVDEGTRIRMCRGQAKTFPDGPYARVIAPAAAIDNSPTDSTIKPADHRMVLVYDALESFASAGGGTKGPEHWVALRQKLLHGDPHVDGDFGLLGMARLRDNMGGLAGRSGLSPYRWWRPAG